jgi:hypothetical protein
MPWAAKAMAWVAMAMPRASKEKTAKEVAWAATAMPRQYQGNAMPRKCEGMPIGYTAMPRSDMAIPCHVLARQCQEFPKTFFQKFSNKKTNIFGCDVWFAPPPPFPKKRFSKSFRKEKKKNDFWF